MDIGLRGPDVPLDQKPGKPSASSGAERGFIDAKEAHAILQAPFILPRFPVVEIPNCSMTSRE